MPDKGRPWITDKQHEFLEDPTSVPSHQRTSKKQSIAQKLEKFVDLLPVIPLLTSRLEDEHYDRIHRNVDAHALGHAIGSMLSARQRDLLLYGLIRADLTEADQDSAVIDQLPSRFEEKRDQLNQWAKNSRVNISRVRFIAWLARQLATLIETVITEKQDQTGTQYPVSEQSVWDWLQTTDPDPSYMTLHRLLTALADPWENVQETADTSVGILVDIVIGEGIDHPLNYTDQAAFNTHWALRLLPSDLAFDRYTPAIEALKPECRAAVETYWTAKRIPAKTQIVSLLEKDLDLTNQHIKDILVKGTRHQDWDELANNQPGWTRHHTRTANALTEQSPQLIEPRETPRAGSAYEYTPLGELVHYLLTNEYQVSSLSDGEFPDDIPRDVLTDALDQVTSAQNP